MPPFDLPAGELDSLATVVHSLNPPAADEPLPGDARTESNSFSANGNAHPVTWCKGAGLLSAPTFPMPDPH